MTLTEPECFECNDSQPNDRLPAVGTIIECPSGNAVVFEQLHNGEIGYSLQSHFYKKGGVWLLNDRKGQGLRIILGNRKPMGFIAQVRVTYHCRFKTCVFGEIVS